MKSIRRLLIQELGTLLGLLAGLLALLLWLGMGRVLDLQMEARASGDLARLQRDLQAQLGQAGHLGEVTRELWRRGRLDPTRPEASAPPLMTLMEGFPGVVSVVVVDAEGNGLVVNRTPGGEPQAQGVNSESDRTRQYPLPGLSKEAWDSWLPMPLPERPWFALARRSTEPRWVDVYPFLSAPAHGLSFIVPLRGADGSFRGAACVDVLLETLSARVWETRPTPGSQTLVCDAQGRALVVPHQSSPGAVYLDRLGPSYHPLFHQLIGLWQESGRPPRNLSLRHEGATYLGRVQPFALDPQTTWFLCLAVPLADYRGPGFHITLGLVGLLALGFGLLVWRMLRLAQRIDRPLAGLWSLDIFMTAVPGWGHAHPCLIRGDLPSPRREYGAGSPPSDPKINLIRF